MEKLSQFATAVGTDIKQINRSIEDLQGSLRTLEGKPEGVTLEVVEQKITALKNALFGGDLEEAYDTFKELADKLKEVDGSIGAAITEKLTEIREELNNFEPLKSALTTDFVQIYNQAKGSQ